MARPCRGTHAGATCGCHCGRPTASQARTLAEQHRMVGHALRVTPTVTMAECRSRARARLQLPCRNENDRATKLAGQAIRPT